MTLEDQIAKLQDERRILRDFLYAVEHGYLQDKERIREMWRIRPDVMFDLCLRVTQT